VKVLAVPVQQLLAPEPFWIETWTLATPSAESDDVPAMGAPALQVVAL
jgi:hypothetical protein